MDKKSLKLRYFAIILSAISTASAPAIANAGWIITSLGTLGGPVTIPLGVNNSGQVVGYSYIGPGNSPHHAFITGPNGVGMIDLGTGQSYSAASDINDSGQVVGYDYAVSSFSVGDLFHFITGPNGVGRTSLGIVGGYGAVMGINETGQVAGDFAIPNRTSHHAFITGPNGAGMIDLATLGGSESRALGVNNLGQVVGYSNTGPGNSPHHAFITGPNGAGMIDLGTLGGPHSLAFDINNSGQVVGFSTTGSGSSPHHAFITGPNGMGMSSLGTLGGSSYAMDINDAGQVIGVSSTADNSVAAFIYSDGLMTNLSLIAPVIAAGWTDLYVQAINNNGQIVGYGNLHGIQRQAFLLSYVAAPLATVSEPGTLLLTGLGLLGFSARRRGRSF